MANLAKPNQKSRCDAKWEASPANSNRREPGRRPTERSSSNLESSPDFGRIRLIAAPIGTGPNPVGAPKPLFEFKTLLHATTL